MSGQPGPLAHAARPPSGEPRGALVLLHGRGADEHDLLPLADLLDPDRRLAVVAPRGPLSLPPGGAHWYALYRLGYPDPATFLSTYARLADWLGSVPELTGVSIERTVLAGFSQGAVMTYALGLGADRPAPAGIVALSGFMPTVEGFELRLDGRDGFPVAIGHGTHDPVIGIEWGRQARERLEAAGAGVLYRETPMAHSIDPGFLRSLVDWLPGVL